MTDSAPLPVTVSSASPLGPKPPSRIVWFVLGFVTARTGAFIIILIAAVVSLAEDQARAAPARQAARQTENHTSDQLAPYGKPDSATTASFSAAETAKLVAHPLLPEGAPMPNLSESEVLAAMWSLVDAARRIRDGGGAIGTIAGEFAHTMEPLSAVRAEPPSEQPLLRAGIDSLSGRMENNDQAFLLGLLGVGSEISKLSEVDHKVSTLHTRLVACRLRVAEVALQSARPESPTNPVTARFAEVGVRLA